jgi:predicted secreted protein
MKKYLIALLFLLPIFVFAADTNAVTVKSAQPQFTISLPGNATTGYVWLPTTYDSHLIKLLSSSYVTDKNTKLMGAPGTFVFNFKALSAAFSAPQSTTITFMYSQPWVTDKTGAEQVQYTVNIVE